MAERFLFLALEDDFKLIAAWFGKIPHEVTVNERPDRLIYYYRRLAKQALTPDVDQSKAPLVFVIKPQKRRRTLVNPSPPSVHRFIQGRPLLIAYVKSPEV